MKVCLLPLLCASFTAQAQMTLYSDALGLPLGSANQVGNTAVYSDALGLPLGSSQTIGNTTMYSDSLGLPAGSSYTFQPIQSGSSIRELLPPASIFPTNPIGR